MRVLRSWKHHILLKRGGIGMLPGGISSAADGSCAVECPACPHNLPPLVSSVSDSGDSGSFDEMDELTLNKEYVKKPVICILSSHFP